MLYARERNVVYFSYYAYGTKHDTLIPTWLKKTKG